MCFAFLSKERINTLVTDTFRRSGGAIYERRGILFIETRGLRTTRVLGGPEASSSPSRPMNESGDFEFKTSEVKNIYFVKNILLLSSVNQNLTIKQSFN